MLLLGDCRDSMAFCLGENEIDSIVTDPPYELAFMGKKWDGTGVAFDAETWRQCLRVLKPGGHLLAFGGTRTYHRMVCAIEDAGFEIRDQIGWAYGSGFPKSLDVSKAIDKEARGFPQGSHRYDPSNPNAGKFKTQRTEGKRDEGDKGQHFGAGPGQFMLEQGVKQPERELAEQARPWQGWGTALKPAWEPIVVARKPLIGTVAANVLAHGTGALNIDGCRVATNDRLGGGAETGTTADQKGNEGWARPWMDDEGARDAHAARVRDNVQKAESLGRWPANLIHDGSDEVVALFPQSAGQLADASTGDSPKTGRVYGAMRREGEPSADSENKGAIGFKMRPGARRLDAGSAARFFYCAKASRSDRNAGLDGMPTRDLNWSSGTQSPGTFQSANTNRSMQNHHPTVKPTDLMRYLCRLVTPPGGTVLDPFMGSGSTGRGAVLEGFRFIGCELSAEYLAIAQSRIAAAAARGPRT